KIRQIDLVGATRFPQKAILQTLELKTPNWLSWYRQDDRYSRESLQGDLEKIRNYYMDRGYANFQLASTQVAIAPEKEDIFITVNIDEGQVYRVSQIKLAGTFVVPQAQLEQLLLIRPGQTFNRKLITSSQELMQNRMGRDGYAFAKVEPVPTADNANHTVALTFFIDPGNRVYVRNISFAGANRINDEVLRREMRQLEGGWLSNTALERSKQRIQRLPYVKSVEFETTPVAGSPDLVDVNYKIEEGPASQLSGGIGYSETYRFMLNGSYADADFLGTGQRIAVNLNGGAFSKVYSVSHTNPYTNIDNLQRTISVSYSDVTQFVSSSSNFSSRTLTFGPTWAYPIAETMYLRAGPLPFRRRHRPREPRQVLDRQLHLPQVRARVPRPDALVPRRCRLRRAPRQHHRDSALPAVLRRGPGLGARLPREPPGSEGPVRQSLWREFPHR